MRSLSTDRKVWQPGMLDDITELRTFVRIAAAGSLSAAGQEVDHRAQRHQQAVGDAGASGGECALLRATHAASP